MKTLFMTARAIHWLIVQADECDEAAQAITDLEALVGELGRLWLSAPTIWKLKCATVGLWAAQRFTGTRT